MEAEVTNPANKHMHYGYTPVITVVQAPDKLPSRIIYSGIEGRKQFARLENDMYDGIKHAKPMEKHKFPAVLKWFFVLTAAASALIFKKDIVKFFKKTIKNPFKSHR